MNFFTKSIIVIYQILLLTDYLLTSNKYGAVVVSIPSYINLFFVLLITLEYARLNADVVLFPIVQIILILHGVVAYIRAIQLSSGQTYDTVIKIIDIVLIILINLPILIKHMAKNISTVPNITSFNSNDNLIDLTTDGDENVGIQNV
jgi:hypothetical protein